MGLLEQIAADVAEIKAALAGGAAAGAAAGAKAPTAAEKKAAEAAAKKAAEAAAAPAFTAEQLRDKFIEVQGKHGDVVTKALIAELGYPKLANLVADTAKWQASWDAAEAKLAEDAGGDDSGL